MHTQRSVRTVLKQRRPTIGRRDERRGGSDYRANDDIRADEIRVVDSEGEQIGIMPPDEGREKAEEKDLDLVEVAPDADPPVCKIMDFGKFKYEQAKKQQSKTDNVTLKEIRMRPQTGEHDLNTKLDQAKGFIEDGNQVRFVMQMRGRERKYTNKWRDKLADIIEDFRERVDRDIKIVSKPESEGWRISSTIEPD
jgi:translation initiation factor IF-3